MSNKRISKSAVNKEGEYGLRTKFLGYNARQDRTTLDPSFMVPPSQNILIGTSGRAALVKGYTLDGSGSSVIDSGILSNYDFTNFKGNVRNMRAGFMTTAANDGKLQYRYVDSNGNVSWINLMTALTSIRLSFCDFWDNTNLIRLVLWVDGSNNIYSWNGAVTTFASATATTLTKQGTTTWAQEGFTPTGSITINGVNATYTGGSTTGTLTGVSVDFSATAVNSEIHQTPTTTALSAMTGPANVTNFTTFSPNLIGCGRKNQVHLGNTSGNMICISKQNTYTDYSYSAPQRKISEGFGLILSAPPTKFIPLENRNDPNTYDMYISEGKNNWGVARAIVDSSLIYETIEHVILKVAPLQGAQSEKLTGKMKNHIIFVGNDNVANFMGYLSFQQIPEMVDFSYPIINDLNSYDLTDGSIFYHKNYIYITVPRSGLVRIYNMTDQTKQQTNTIKGVEDIDNDQPWFWEAPIKYPISGLFVTSDGKLGGHGYNTSESYILFNGGSFNGQDIEANLTFAFDDKGDRTQSKASDELWVEGYIKQNTTLNASVIGDLDAFQSSQTVQIVGNDNKIVAFGAGAHSLGTISLGSQPHGGSSTTITTSSLPAWFHVSKTYPQVPSYLEQISFYSKGVDLQWELIAFGTNSRLTAEGNNSITQ